MMNFFLYYFVVVTIRFGGAAIEQTVISEAAGFLNDSLYIIRDGETEQPLSVQLMVTDFGATEGRTGLLGERVTYSADICQTLNHRGIFFLL